jgi:hypothetical protein
MVNSNGPPISISVLQIVSWQHLFRVHVCDQTAYPVGTLHIAHREVYFGLGISASAQLNSYAVTGRVPQSAVDANKSVVTCTSTDEALWKACSSYPGWFVHEQPVVKFKFISGYSSSALHLKSKAPWTALHNLFNVLCKLSISTTSAGV